MPFSEKSLSFLFENRVKDSREWFNSHRGEYNEYVLSPMAELVEALTPTMLQIDPDIICDPKIGKTISRIWRDTRFAKDKSIFREVMWFTFMRERKLYHGLPAFWFEMSPFGFRWGCGWYSASPEVMGTLRDMILAGAPLWQAAQEAYKSLEDFHLEDERFKRGRYPDRPEEEREWLEQKTLCLTRTGTDKALLFSDELARTLAADFRRLAPVYDFFVTAERATPKHE